MVNSAILLSLIVLSLTANRAFAVKGGHVCRCHHCLSAPEIDPGQTIGALSLLAGSAAMVRWYRRKEK